MKVESFGLSDIGLVRLNNEDVWAQMPKEQFFILTDGMGGHQAGEVAANETILSLCQIIKQAFHTPHSIEEWVSVLKEGIEKTNTWIHHLASQDKDLEGMGTTLCLLLILDKTLIYGHVGDSRIYRIRKGRMTQLTEDHSLKAELIAKGQLDESQARNFSRKNVITRAIGTQATVIPEMQTQEIKPEDVYFLCSDGLTDALTDTQIQATIDRSFSIQEATQALILNAKKAGGADNITVLILKVR